MSITARREAPRSYTRWRIDEVTPGTLWADILSMPLSICAHRTDGLVQVMLAAHTATLTPDEARLIGVRLVEAAALADGDRAVRARPEAVGRIP